MRVRIVLLCHFIRLSSERLRHRHEPSASPKSNSTTVRLSEKEHKKVHASAAKEEKVRKVKNTAVSFNSNRFTMHEHYR